MRRSQVGYFFSASGAILIVSHSPHGLDEIHRLLSSSIIGATQREVWTFGVLVVLTTLALATSHRRAAFCP